MIEIIIISILGVLVVTLGFTTFNLLRKVEKYEDLAKHYAKLFVQTKQAINHSNNLLEEIDKRGTFKSDDEIGWFFDQIKHMQEVFNNFNEEL